MTEKQMQPQNKAALKVTTLVAQMNRYRHEYYNLAKPSVPDFVYDHLFEELLALEKETGIVLSDSPTQTVGYMPAGRLKKVKHPIPLLSLDKTKQTEELVQMAGKSDALLMLKLDGLTIKLCYENGRLTEASTRGDGDTGEDITHNIPAFFNVPVSIPYTGRLVLTGEGLIHQNDFEEIKNSFPQKADEECGNVRNLAAGSIRLLNPAVCRKRRIYFYAFNVMEGMEGFGEIADSRGKLLEAMQGLGFTVCPFVRLGKDATVEEIEGKIDGLKGIAEKKHVPIDGMVLRYDSLSYSAACGRTGHHYRDGIAFKFEDDACETVFRFIEWKTGRSGEIAPVAHFDMVKIDGCKVSKASLHNLSFIRELELHAGCRILVSKRNMIIPHIEENLDRGNYKENIIPKNCPCCGKPARVYSRDGGRGRMAATLHCDNPDCGDRRLKSFVHFAGKKAMDISGISEAVIDRFIRMGFLHTFHDFYHLDRHKMDIMQMAGFGEKSYGRIWESVERSRHTTFVRYTVAMDIPMVGRSAAKELDKYFHGDLRAFAEAAGNGFDFTVLPYFGETLGRNIREWFKDRKNRELWESLQKELYFEEDNTMDTTNMAGEMKDDNPFTGCTIVATGKLQNFTRSGINSRIASLGATAGSSVTGKTDYLICGEKPGSKLAKAKKLGIPVLTEQEFLGMIPA